jgi:hypothetical protein
VKKTLNRPTDKVLAALSAVGVFVALVGGVYVLPTAVHCHHHRGHLVVSGIHVQCAAQHVVRYVPMQ